MDQVPKRDWSAFACPNPRCSAFGQRGQANLRPHGWSSKAHGIRCLRCTVCGKSFSERAGTPLFHSRLPEEKAVQIREMELRQFSPCTIESYLTAVIGLSRFYHRSPDQLNLEEIRSYLHHVLTERKVAQSTCNQRAAGLTFFYRHVLGQEAFDLKIRRKHSGKLPEVYSQQELVRLFDATRSRRDRVLRESPGAHRCMALHFWLVALLEPCQQVGLFVVRQGEWG